MNKNNTYEFNKLKIFIQIMFVTASFVIYLINFTTIGLDIGFDVKPNVLIKKEFANSYLYLCEDGIRPIENYKCRTNKKILNSMSSIETVILKKERYLKYFTNVSYIGITGDNNVYSKDDVENKLKYLNLNKITYLYIDKYNGEDLDFVLKLKNLETLIIIDAKNLGNYDKIVGMKKLGYIDINDEVIKND